MFSIPILFSFKSNNNTQAGKIIITIIGVNNNPVLEYANMELNNFLKKILSSTGNNHEIKEIVFNFIINKQLPESGFAVDSKKKKNKLVLNFPGIRHLIYCMHLILFLKK